MNAPLHPLRLKPVYKDYLWGGSRIPQVFGRNLPPGIYAESWEVADRPEGMGVVAAGAWAGRTLHELVEALGADLLGERGRSFPVLPLLIKLIDARQTLSVQVHPDNATAARHGGEAKTEMWYVLDAAPGAFVYGGLQPGVTPEAFAKAVADQTVERLLQRVAVRPGDAVFIPGGRVHAIGAGCLLLECQQNSNTTYRIYDFGRVGADGKPRELHLEQAARVIRWDDHASPLAVPRVLERRGEAERREILATPFFRMEQLRLAGQPWALEADPGTFRVLFVERGALRLEAGAHAETVRYGETLLIPAACPALKLVPLDADARVLLMGLP